MAALSAHVRQTGADIGLAFDGDADRVGVVDEAGAIIAPDRLLALLALDTLARHPGAEIIADVTCSQVVFDAIAGAGGVPVIWPTGHSLIKARMRQSGAPLAGEISGYYGYDDGFFAALRLLEILSRGDQPLSALDARLPRLFSTPVYRPHCPPEFMQPALEAVQTALAGRGELLTIDGLRFRFERGWGIVRASNTESVLSMRFEGQTESDAFQYRDWVFAALQPFPAIYKALEKT
jgi:phosphomannomutase